MSKAEFKTYNNAARTLIESFYSLYISMPPRRTRRTTKFKANGNRECDRRKRQIERGQLTASNGLVLS